MPVLLEEALMPSRERPIGPEVSVRVAANMAALREARGWTRPQLSREMALAGYEMSDKTIFTIERGAPPQRLFTIDEVVALAEVFGVSVAYLTRRTHGTAPVPQDAVAAGEEGGAGDLAVGGDGVPGAARGRERRSLCLCGAECEGEPRTGFPGP